MLLKKKNSFQKLGYMVDCSRGAVLKVEALKRLIDILKRFGYDYLMLYIEDIYEIDGEPYFGYMRGRYSKEEIKEIDQYANKKGIELRPCIQTLAHLARLRRHGCYDDLFEIDDILEVNKDETYKLIDKMLNAISSLFTSKNVHIGMDEAYYLGRGRILDKNGYISKKKLMETHLEKVSEIAKKYGLNCQIWSDMIFRAYNESDNKENFTIQIPNNVMVMDWRYYLKSDEESLKEFNLYNKLTNNNFAFASGAHKWYGFVPNNIYSMHIFNEQIKNCKKTGVKEFLVTGWADGAADASIFSTLPALFYASTLAHNLDLKDTKPLFKKIIGIEFDDYLKIDNFNRLTLNKESVKINNLSFIYFYNDLFQGLFDSAILPNVNELISNKLKELKSITYSNNKLRYVFNSMIAYGEFLLNKAKLSKDIYDHYKTKNNEALNVDLKTLANAIKRLNMFIKQYNIQWHQENKSFGYEKQCIRYGGLLQRLKYCQKQLKKYLNHKISKIDELEEKHLPISLSIYNPDQLDSLVYNNYASIVSGGSLKEI